VEEPTEFDINRGAIFGRRGLAAAVRSEAQDERLSPAASNLTLSAKIKRACFEALFYFGGAGLVEEPTEGYGRPRASFRPRFIEGRSIQ
jgi:hypothetical protein